MKISTAGDTVIERTGIASDGAFRINFSAKMAKILSDGIYSNKPEAICRELGCNALDSHVMAGKGTVPIEIHLPTPLEPFFHVRDFGLGLDHDEVQNIFTVYGESTKTGTNDAVGQLGLGSKVPFAYCDAFDVVARKNGVERHYSMYKNETGLPSCALLLETATTECNGVTVKLAVPRGDFANFADSARNVFRWFDVPPRFTGVSDIGLPTMEYEFSGSSWGLRKNRNGRYGHSSQSFALMGPVAYPIDARNIKGISAHRGLQELLRLPLVLKFNIGDLDMAVSREALSYDERTQKAVLDKLATVLLELEQQIGTRIGGAATLWDAHVAWADTFNSGDWRYEFSTIYGNTGIWWQDQLIKSSEMRIAVKDMYGDHTAGLRFHLQRLSFGSRRIRDESFYEAISLPTSKRTVIVFNDLDKGTSSRILKLAEENDNDINVYCFPPSTIKTWQEMEDMLHGAPIVMASSLPKNTRARVKTDTLQYAPQGTTRTGMNAWKRAAVDLEDGGFYVRLNRWDVMEKDNDVVRGLGEITELANDLNIKLDTPIYAARDSAMKKAMAENADWVNVLDYLREQVTSRLTPEVLKLIASRDDYAQVRGMFYDESLWRNKFAVDAQSPWHQFMEAVRKLQQDARQGGTMVKWTMLARLLGMEVANNHYATDVPAQAAALDQLYPMARTITSRWITTEAVGMLTEYVKSMDELRALREQKITVNV